MDVEGKIAAITGGASGIGRATADLLAQHGACGGEEERGEASAPAAHGPAPAAHRPTTSRSPSIVGRPARWIFRRALSTSYATRSKYTIFSSESKIA